MDRVVECGLWWADVSVAAARERAPTRVDAGMDIISFLAHGDDGEALFMLVLIFGRLRESAREERKERIPKKEFFFIFFFTSLMQASGDRALGFYPSK